MTYALIGLALWAIHGIAASIFTFKGTRNRHTPAGIWLTGDPHVAVQEKGEFRFARIVAVALGLGLTFIWPPLALGGVAIGEIGTRENFGGLRNPIGKWVDIAGHGAEIMATEGIAGYREREAASVARQYDMSHMEALEALDDMRWLSRIIHKLGSL